MVIAITATPVVDGLYVDYSVSGLTPGLRYDMYRIQRRYIGNDLDTGAPMYDYELPDRQQLYSALAHRVSWLAPTATVTFRDYEPPLRPHSLYIVESTKTNPGEFAWKEGATYDRSQGVIDDQIIHFNRELAALGDVHEGAVVVRSTQELGLWSSCCVYDLTVAYNARATELPVLGQGFATVVVDTREARRGTLTVVTRNLGDYYDLRRIVFPATHRIKPIVLAAGGDPTMMLDDMTCLPMNISIDQATQADPNVRFVGIDYVEIAPTAPLVYRAGDNDNEVAKPVAYFTMSDTTPRRNQTITLTDGSTGQFETWDWTLPANTTLAMGKANRQGPLKVQFKTTGRKTVKLTVRGHAGASTKVRTFNVSR